MSFLIWLGAIWHWYQSIPTVIKRLTGAFLVAFIGWTCLLIYGHVRESHGFDRGYAVAADSAAEATILRLKAQHLADEARSDSTFAAAKKADSTFHIVLQATPKLPPHIARIEPNDSIIPSIPLSSLVRIITQEPDTGYATPNMAHLLAWQDTAIYHVLLPQRDSAIALALKWRSAWTDENAARIGADSLSELWRARALAGIPVKTSVSWKRNFVYAALGATLALVARNQVHR